MKLYFSTLYSATVLFLCSVHARETPLDNTYDYVIVGGGTSGLTVADRLTENQHGRFRGIHSSSCIFDHRS